MKQPTTYSHSRKIRIIDNKKIALTDDEFKLYQEMCKSYDAEYFQGSDLFKGLFETDDKGFIIFLKTPKQLTSMEVWMFLINLMVHQHIDCGLNEIERIRQEYLKELQALKVKS